MADRPATTSQKNKPGRKRLAAGWTLLVIGVLITGVWGASRWITMNVIHDPWRVKLVVGQLTIEHFDGPLPTELAQEPAGVSWENSAGGVWQWTYSLDRAGETEGRGFTVNQCVLLLWVLTPVRTIASIILWPFALASLLGGGWLVWSRRRAMTGVCCKCGYDLSWLAAGAPCPECGVSNLPMARRTFNPGSP